MTLIRPIPVQLALNGQISIKREQNMLQSLAVDNYDRLSSLKFP